jgi:hypothetical protein
MVYFEGGIGGRSYLTFGSLDLIAYLTSIQFCQVSPDSQRLQATFRNDASPFLAAGPATRREPGGAAYSAFDVLQHALPRHGRKPIVLLNLARYACQSGRLKEAKNWLAKARSEGWNSR